MSDFIIFNWLALCAAFVGALYTVVRTLKPQNHVPGPPGTFLFGNALQIPTESPWLKFTEWGTIYGGIIFARVFSRRLIIVNSYESAVELFEKRSGNYADRPHRFMAELSGFGQAMLFKNYGEDVKKGRRLIHAGLGPRDLQACYAMFMGEANVFAKSLLDDPSGFRQHIRRTLTTCLLQFTYGHKVDSEHDILVPLAEEVMHITGKLISPNRYAVDVFPFLNSLPEGFPGTGFKAVARENNEKIESLFTIPFLKVKEQAVNGMAEPSFTANHMEGNVDNMSQNDLHLLKWTAGIINAAGVDTTASVISSFFLAMVLHPELQIEAQRELDSVLGTCVLPTFGDRERLPFIECIIKESLRWHPPTPLIARSLREDDIFDGCVLPAKSFVIANVWAYTHDPKFYPEPFEFKPHRFKVDSQTEVPPDPRLYIFGMGRRRCPGTELANHLSYLLISTTLALFKILPELDEHGKPIMPEVKYTTTLTSHPVPFSCRIVPRFPEIAELIGYGLDS